MRQKLLYLTHRIPFPPNKGDKVRSYHLLKHLASRFDLLLGSFVDDPADLKYRDEVARYCSEMHIVRLDPRMAKLKSLSGFLRGEALSLPYYRDAGLAAWVDDMVRRHALRRALVFSSPMAQYIAGHAGVSAVVDFVDVDSDKWRQYAKQRSWPWSAIYAREGARLLEFERSVAAHARESFFVTDAEAELFRQLAPQSAARVSHFCNGVDTDYFRPDEALASPYREDEEAVVFTGAMDYWPNVDAACWFADEVLPALLRQRPRIRFYIVGMNPTPAVTALASRDSIVVTGRVADVRPYLHHARVAVAPLRIARGIQNKVLEAMAMSRPVVVSATCAGPLAAQPGVEISVAESPEEFVRATLALLDGPQSQAMGIAARARVLADFNWEANLRRVDAALERCLTSPSGVDTPSAASSSATRICA